jgi:hypothetical protein
MRCAGTRDAIVVAVNADFGIRAGAETKLVEVMGPILEARHALSHITPLDEVTPAQHHCCSSPTALGCSTSPRAWSASSAPGISRCT